MLTCTPTHAHTHMYTLQCNVPFIIINNAERCFIFVFLSDFCFSENGNCD